MAGIGIVAIHGVIPQVRYGFQDQVAEQLRSALDTYEKTSDEWRTCIVFPSKPTGAAAPPLTYPPVAPTSHAGSSQSTPPTTDPSNPPTVTRVYRAGESNPDNPNSDYFDVIEAYWSPIDKGKTTAFRVLNWLLTTVFLPLNDTARFMARRNKIRWDIGYLLVALASGSACFALCIAIAGWALENSRLPAEGGLKVLGAPFLFLGSLTPIEYAGMIAGLVGGYLAAQTIRAVYSLYANSSIRRADGKQLRSRRWAITLLGLSSLSGMCICGWLIGPQGLGLALTVLLFQAGRALLLWFLQNFFGDVEIYTTRDENSDFFSLREQILDLVNRTITYAVQQSPGCKPYERVHVLAHSLGSTIALDALMRIYNAQKTGAVTPEAWSRIRSFITFGSSLEKTKYFFNAWSPTQSQSYQEWQDDLYGPLFTADPGALTAGIQTQGIFWLNCSYFTDFVSNEIASYRSYLLPGESPSQKYQNRKDAQEHAIKTGDVVAGRLVAANRTRRGDFSIKHLVTHGDYLGDQRWFWAGLPDEPAESGADSRHDRAADGSELEVGVIDVLVTGLAIERISANKSRLVIALGAEVDITPEGGDGRFQSNPEIDELVESGNSSKQPVQRRAWDAAKIADVEQFVTSDLYFASAEDKRKAN